MPHSMMEAFRMVNFDSKEDCDIKEPPQCSTLDVGVSRTIRDEPPTHFELKIESFSLFSKYSSEKYHSRSFKAGGYKWRLCLYPNGNKDRDGEGHISLYLEIVETRSLNPGWEVHALFTMFVLDQHKDKYLTIQDFNGRTKRFRALKTQSGFDRLITLKEFNNPTNGFLVNDTCSLGVEVFVHKESVAGIGECLSLTSEPNPNYKHTWTIEAFSQEEGDECRLSRNFVAGDHQWSITLFTEVDEPETTVCFTLGLRNPRLKRRVYVEFMLLMLDQINGEHVEYKGIYSFSKFNYTSGMQDFMPVNIFRHKSKGYLVNDTCIIEAHILLMGSVEELDQLERESEGYRFC